MHEKAARRVTIRAERRVTLPTLLSAPRQSVAFFSPAWLRSSAAWPQVEGPRTGWFSSVVHPISSSSVWSSSPPQPGEEWRPFGGQKPMSRLSSAFALPRKDYSYTCWGSEKLGYPRRFVKQRIMQSGLEVARTTRATIIMKPQPEQGSAGSKH